MAAMCSSGRKKGDDPSVCGAVSSIPDVCEASHRAGSKEKKKKFMKILKNLENLKNVKKNKKNLTGRSTGRSTVSVSFLKKIVAETVFCQCMQG